MQTILYFLFNKPIYIFFINLHRIILIQKKSHIKFWQLERPIGKKWNKNDYPSMKKTVKPAVSLFTGAFLFKYFSYTFWYHLLDIWLHQKTCKAVNK